MDLRNPNVRPLIIAIVILGSLAQLILLAALGLISLSGAVSVIPKLVLLATATTALIVFVDRQIVSKNLFGKYGHFVGMPEFGGRWEGWKRSELSKNKAWKRICIEIDQGFFISAHEVGEGAEAGQQNQSQSVTNAEFTSNNHSYRLVYTYSTVRDGHASRTEEPHDGTFVLTMAKRDRHAMTGEYFTNITRFGSDTPGVGTRGALGVVRLKKSKGKRVGALDNGSGSWAMEMPTD